MFERIKHWVSKGFWQALAVVIVLIIAGPEIMISMELMAMVELLGASTFVLMHLSGIKTFLKTLAVKYQDFERYSVFVIPPLNLLKRMPSIAIHAIPERTTVIVLYGVLTIGMFTLIAKQLIIL